tara:strand:- start:496 stop:1308 length:813 start_codon:yes stop_codon:yes gene_type:complete
MLGAIIGDIVGSKYEFNNIKTKDFPLFSEGCSFTDDTLLTIAVADWLLDGTSDLTEKLVSYTREYPHLSYGQRYRRWAFGSDHRPYNSYGNGAAMRVAPVLWFAQSPEEAKDLARASAEVTHNHPEGIKGAQATALAGWLGGDGFSPEDIRDIITGEFGYDLTKTVDEIREDYAFDETCQGTVPQAIICALEATDFEDAIRNAISIGGDSDTVAAITGGVAEAMFPIPHDIAREAMAYLPDDFEEVLRRGAIAVQCAQLPGQTACALVVH